MIGKVVTITPSPALTLIKIGELAGRQGIVVALTQNGKGAYVQFSEPFLGHEEWYIPNESIKVIL